MKGLITIEEYLDKHRTEYYDILALGEKEVTDYVKFMLEDLAETLESAKNLIFNKKINTT